MIVRFRQRKYLFPNKMKCFDQYHLILKLTITLKLLFLTQLTILSIASNLESRNERKILIPESGYVSRNFIDEQNNTYPTNLLRLSKRSPTTNSNKNLCAQDRKLKNDLNRTNCSEIALISWDAPNFEFSNTTKPQSKAKKDRKLDLDTKDYFIENVQDYPETDIKLALSNASEAFLALFNSLDLNASLSERTVTDDDSEDRMPDGFHGQRVCKSRKMLKKPQASNYNSERVLIANTQDFVQIVEMEVCMSHREQCDYLRDNLPQGMISFCKQGFSYKRLLYIDSEKKLQIGDFRFPSCCSCYVVEMSTLDLRAISNDTETKNSQKSQSKYEKGNSFSNISPTFEVSQFENYQNSDSSRLAKMLNTTNCSSSNKEDRQNCTVTVSRNTRTNSEIKATKPKQRNLTLTVVTQEDSVFKSELQ